MTRRLVNTGHGLVSAAGGAARVVEQTKKLGKPESTETESG
jgi:hypothetical protein